MPSTDNLDFDLGAGGDLDLDLDFDLSLEEKAPAPVVEYNGDPEHDCAAELNAVQQGFVDRAKNEAARYRKATETGYWVCMCFQTQDQATAFAMATTGKPDRFADGCKAAKQLKIALPADTAGYSAAKQPGRRLADLAMKL